jgi:hypothetical protein
MNTFKKGRLVIYFCPIDCQCCHIMSSSPFVHMNKSSSSNSSSNSDRKIAIVAAMFVIGIAIIDILATRNLLPYDNFSGLIIFALNIAIAYGIGSYFILRYIKRVSADIRAKSRFLNSLFWVVTAVQAFLFVTLIVMAIEFYYYQVSVRYMTYTVFATSTIAATTIMGVAAFRFFSWYRAGERTGDKNRLILICGLAGVALCAAMTFEATAKLLLVRVVEEESPPGITPLDDFLYDDDEKYQGEVQYKVVKPETTTLYIVPWSITLLYSYVNGWIPITISFVFIWAITTILLRQYHQRVLGKMPVIMLVMLILPLALYMVGRTSEWYTVFTGQNIQWQDIVQNGAIIRHIFRVASICGNIMFGVAFFIVARSMPSGRLKDYLTIAAIGAAMMGITLSPSAQQQTFGVAGHALMLLASFMLSSGFYLSAVSMAQDAKLRKSVKSVIESKVLLDTIATAEYNQQIEKTILNIVKKERETIENQTGIKPPLEEDVKQYLDEVLDEVHRSKASQAA